MSCTSIISAVGTKLYVAPSANLPVTYDAAGWAGVTGWVEVGEIGSIGEYGQEANLIEYKSLSGTICKAKGSTNYGSAEIGMALVPEDAGQIDMQEAVVSKLSFPVKIVYNDATDALDVDSVDYFAALFMSFKKNPGSDPDAIMMAKCTMELNSEVIFVPRHATPVVS